MSLAADQYLAALADKFDLSTSEGRIRATVDNPLAMASIYFPHHLKNADGEVTFADVHVDWSDHATHFITMERTRDAYIAPRNCGKSTWWFTIIPLWAAAHGHSKFTAAFADAATQAEGHLLTFKNELDTNDLLRQDFPDLCSPARRNTGASQGDSRNMYIARSGFAFAARGVDSAVLGLKVNQTRPDLIILDDIEPPGDLYSLDQAEKRLNTVIDAIMPMNDRARVVFVGTVTMPGSIIHQLVRSVTSEAEEPEEWIKDEKVSAHYYPPILTDDNGTERSIWPEKWPLAYLKGIQHTRQFAKNFRNMPVSADGDYWEPDDIHYTQTTLPDGEPFTPGVTRTIISVDPAVSTRARSDFTGIATVSLRPPRRSRDGKVAEEPLVTVRDCVAVKLSGAMLRKRVIKAIQDAGVPIQCVLIEVNQGGDVWKSVFHSMPVPLTFIRHSVDKETRAAALLNHYQRGRVEHLRPLGALEEQQLAYPHVMNDDLIDAVGTGVSYFARRRKNTKPGATNVNYLRGTA